MKQLNGDVIELFYKFLQGSNKKCMKILMTDDDYDDRLLALVAFKELNGAHSIDFVTNGQELIDYLTTRLALKRELPDLILLDLNMPMKDGRETLQEIKGHPKLRHLDVIIFSTSNSQTDREFTLGLGAREYIVKPPDQDKLKDVFMQICDDLITKPGWRYAIDQQVISKKIKLVTNKLKSA